MTPKIYTDLEGHLRWKIQGLDKTDVPFYLQGDLSFGSEKTLRQNLEECIDILKEGKNVYYAAPVYVQPLEVLKKLESFKKFSEGGPCKAGYIMIGQINPSNFNTLFYTVHRCSGEQIAYSSHHQLNLDQVTDHLHHLKTSPVVEVGAK